MAVAQVKIAEDQYQNKMQFSHINAASALTVTTAVQWDTTQARHVVITPTTADAYVTVAATAITPTGTGTGTSLGKFINFGSSYTTIIRKDEYIGASAAVNVVELGEL